MENGRSGASFVLRTQKWGQIALAILLTGFFVLLLPGFGIYGVPLGCVYIAWAVRANSDHRFSAWLAFLFTLIVALLFGRVVVGGIPRLLNGQAVSLLELLIELTLFLLAAMVVVLHGSNWRWLLSPGTRTQH